MAKRSQKCSDINISMCKIKKQVAGNHLVTTGSACVLRWPWKVATSQPQASNQTFVITTSQVVTKSDLSSDTAWKAEFIPMKWHRSEKFSLNHATVHEIPLSCSDDQAITLILISTESLHTQKVLSRWRSDQLQSSRSQLCQQKEDESEFQTANEKQSLCFVLSETASENDKFSLQCYLLCMAEDGTYFLQDHGNKAQLRTLKDFQSTEKPKGSIILNENGEAEGVLAFGDKDEVLPLFFLENTQDTKTANGSTQVERPGAESQSCDSVNDYDADANQNQKKDTSHDSDQRHSKSSSEDTESSHSSMEDPDDERLELKSINEKILGNQRQPQEFWFPSLPVIEPHTGEGNHVGDNNRETTHGGEDGLRGLLQGGQANQHPNGTLTRASTLQPTPSPRTQRRLFKSKSEMRQVSLKPGALVSDVILYNVYVMDTIRRYLDMSCKGTQNWRHLGILNDVSTDLQLKWESGERHCRSEKMFEALAATDPDLPLGTLMQHLRNLKINDVELYIRKLNLDDHMNIQDFFESTDSNIPGRALIMLDLIPEETWQNLGVNMGLDREKLKGIKIDCANQQQNPAGDVINIIKSSQPTMTIGQFKKHLTNIERADVAKTLHGLSDKETISGLLDDLDLMRRVTSMLNVPGNLHLKNYKDFADECGIPRNLYETLQPPCEDSPTREVLNDIVRRKPQFTVEDLFNNFREMKRLDVIEAISCYFVGEDMMAMKRKLKLSDE